MTTMYRVRVEKRPLNSVAPQVSYRGPFAAYEPACAVARSIQDAAQRGGLDTTASIETLTALWAPTVGREQTA